jgi:hypothetical protein
LPIGLRVGIGLGRDVGLVIGAKRSVQVIGVTSEYRHEFKELLRRHRTYWGGSEGSCSKCGSDRDRSDNLFEHGIH